MFFCSSSPLAERMVHLQASRRHRVERSSNKVAPRCTANAVSLKHRIENTRLTINKNILSHVFVYIARNLFLISYDRREVP
jgi:hypothetical protein